MHYKNSPEKKEANYSPHKNKMPSQTREKTYTVKNGKQWKCTFTDYQQQESKCKHQWAVELKLTRKLDKNGNILQEKAEIEKQQGQNSNPLQSSLQGKLDCLPFKKNASSKSKGCCEWKRMYQLFHDKEGRFKNYYHKKSNVESTFNAIKQRFGKSLNCRDKKALETEMLAKVLCYNICTVIRAMYKLDIDIRYNNV